MGTFDPIPPERRPWVSITFAGGAFFTDWDPDIWIYYKRKDAYLSHIMLNGDYIDGEHIEEIKHRNLEGRVRYV